MLAHTMECGRVLSITFTFTFDVFIIEGLRITKVGARKMVQSLRVQPTLPEDKSLVSSKYGGSQHQ